MAGRRSRRGSPTWLNGLAVGVVLGAGLVIGALLAWHGPPPGPPPPAAVRPRPVSPAPPRGAGVRPPIPRQNPEVSQGPAIGPGAPERPAPHGTARGPAGPAQPSGPGGTGRPRVAIIFDDAGYSLAAAREVMALGRPVTMSVLPDLPYSTQIAEEAPPRGVQIILHLPLEPDNPGIPLGPGGVTVDMSGPAIQKTVAADLATVPTAVGANNHMGSLGTSDPRVMRAVITVIKSRHLFFVDSLTSPHSVAAQVAREMGVPTTTRAVFLDNENTDAYVRAQLHTLIRLALSRGQAVAIGHVGKVTAAVLQSMFPEFDEAGIQFVTVSQIVH